MGKWLYLALCAAGVLTAACLMALLASLITGMPAYGAVPDPCAALALDAGARPVYRHAGPALTDLAATVWAESRGEALCGQVAVAYTAINRTRINPDAWGKTVSAVVRKPRQYSVWNTAKQRRRLENLDERAPGFASARLAAALALSGAVPDPTRGAVYFHASGIKPRWARRLTGQRIGNHVFYRARH